MFFPLLLVGEGGEGLDGADDVFRSVPEPGLPQLLLRDFATELVQGREGVEGGVGGGRGARAREGGGGLC